MLEVIKYDRFLRIEWDHHIKKSKNGTFLFYRDYLEYNSDFSNELSYILLKNKKIIAVFPGQIINNFYYSYKNLTYGGIISSREAREGEITFFLGCVIEDLKKQKIKGIYYKPVPYIYHIYPAQEDIYALHMKGANKIDIQISSVIDKSNPNNISELRKRGIKKAIKNNIIIEESDKYFFIWQLIADNLKKKYNSKPVHSFEQIFYLKKHFPENIKFYSATFDGEIVAGVILFLTPLVMKFQYISSNETGRKTGALDYLIWTLVFNSYKEIRYADMGTSYYPENGLLNEKLLFQKEGFGARAITIDTYYLEI